MNYVTDIPETMPLEERKYVSLFLRADSKKHVYNIERYDLLSFLGDMGGLYDIVILIGGSLTSFFSKSMM